MENFNFQATIKKMQTENLEACNAEGENNGNIIVIRRLQKTGQVNYYALHKGKSALLGSGGYGQVYRGYPINSETGLIDPTKKPVAIKWIKNRNKDGEIFKKQISKEAEKQKIFYPQTEQPVFTNVEGNLCAILIGPLLPGEVCTDKNDKLYKLKEKFQSLDLTAAVTALWQLALQLQWMHSMGLVHADFKMENFHLDMQEEKEGGRSETTVNTWLYDYGLTDYFDTETGESEPTSEPGRGSLAYSGQEVLWKDAVGPKSDVLSFTAALIYLLTTTIAPLESRLKADKWQEVYQPFDIDENSLRPLKDNAELPEEMQEYIFAFMRWTQLKEYAERPNIHLVVRFLTTLRLYCLTLHDNRTPWQQKEEQLTPNEKSELVQKHADHLKELVKKRKISQEESTKRLDQYKQAMLMSNEDIEQEKQELIEQYTKHLGPLVLKQEIAENEKALRLQEYKQTITARLNTNWQPSKDNSLNSKELAAGYIKKTTAEDKKGLQAYYAAELKKLAVLPLLREKIEELQKYITEKQKLITEGKKYGGSRLGHPLERKVAGAKFLLNKAQEQYQDVDNKEAQGEMRKINVKIDDKMYNALNEGKLGTLNEEISAIGHISINRKRVS